MTEGTKSALYEIRKELLKESKNCMVITINNKVSYYFDLVFAKDM